MKIKYHRNWENVCKLQNELLKYLVTWLTWGNDEVIAKMNMAFPELFNEHEMPIKIPASSLRKAAVQSYLEFQAEYNDKPKETIEHLRFAEWFQWNLKHHRFPEIYFFGNQGPDYEEIPAEVLEQLKGAEFITGKPIHVTYEGEDCLVGYVLDMSGSGSELKSGWMFELTNHMNIDLVPAKYIDLNA